MCCGKVLKKKWVKMTNFENVILNWENGFFVAKKFFHPQKISKFVSNAV
jgi:hypothetical protein